MDLSYLFALPENYYAWIPPVLVGLSLLAAIIIFPLRENQVKTRTTVNIGAAVLKLLLVLLLFPIVISDSEHPEFTMPFLPGIDLVLRVDELSLFFATLSAMLWLLTTIYAIGYLEKGQSRSRFFGFFSLCVTATIGISFSGNLITFLVLYELLTLVTYPLVAHWGKPSSLRAARIYLRYTLVGGLALLLGVIWLTMYAGSADFAPGGADGVAELAQESPAIATMIFALLIIGLGVKAAIFPLHSWLPKAMVAPAPVSALLHAVAVVKAGAFGIVRVVDDVYGIDVAKQLGVLTPLLAIACFTIIYGSYQALRQRDLKKRLAFSTVSQVSYVIVGISLGTVVAATGGIVHLVHQGLMKITLFFCAGLFAETAGATKIEHLNGLGKRLPGTSAAFTIGAFGMIGLPPTAGFISKWMLGAGALESDHSWVLWVLVTSSILNALYFLPVVYALWFGDEQKSPLPDAHLTTRHKEPPALLIPTVITAASILIVGIAASLQYMPLDIARQIAEGVFG